MLRTISRGKAEMPGPLAGVKVIDLSQVIVGPATSQVLADQGADVIKIESHEGDLMRNMAGKSKTPGMGSKFLHLNANKRSIVLDLKSDEGYAILNKLIRGADVVLWNFRPAAMKALKLTYDDVKRVKPDIIYCGILGFGRGGCYFGRQAYDASIQGAGGFAALNHLSHGEPRFVAMSVADRLCAVIAAQTITAALFRKERTGEGCAIEVPMFENVAKFVLDDQMYLRTFEPPLGEAGDPRSLHPLSKPTRTKDGWLCISPNTNEQAFAFFDLVGRPELKFDPKFSTVQARYANIGEFFRIREASMKSRTNEVWMAEFDRVGVPAMPYNSLDDLFEDPHLRETNFFAFDEHPTEGKLRTARSPNKWSFDTHYKWTPAPFLGQHSKEILLELGYQVSDIDRLNASGVALVTDKPPTTPKNRRSEIPS
jgi:crotonobetainyl-CoA:carnitine CoA-transferase CaiB-like acyl-CoA transferase